MFASGNVVFCCVFPTFAVNKSTLASLSSILATSKSVFVSRKSGGAEGVGKNLTKDTSLPLQMEASVKTIFLYMTIGLTVFTRTAFRF